MTANWINGQIIHLERVHPHYTSQAVHLDCLQDPAGKIRRKAGNLEQGKCSSCKILVPIHYHAARIIRNRGYQQYTLHPD